MSHVDVCDAGSQEGSWSLLSIRRDLMVVSCSSPNCPPDLVQRSHVLESRHGPVLMRCLDICDLCVPSAASGIPAGQGLGEHHVMGHAGGISTSDRCQLADLKLQPATRRPQQPIP